MSHLFHKTVLVIFLSLGAACAETGDLGDGASDPCPPVDGDKHLAVATVKPAGYSVMLHTVGKACPTVGESSFALYPTSKMGAHQTMAMAMTDGTAAPGADAILAVASVTISMPAMGHGPAEAPKLDAAHANRFSAQFQMPGAWRAEVKFVAEDVTTTVQTAVFDFTVQ